MHCIVENRASDREHSFRVHEFLIHSNIIYVCTSLRYGNVVKRLKSEKLSIVDNDMAASILYPSITIRLRTNERTKEQTNERTNERTNKQTNKQTCGPFALRIRNECSVQKKSQMIAKPPILKDSSQVTISEKIARP